MGVLIRTWNTDFYTIATEITEANQYDFFQYDHTAILFRDDKRTKKNFVHATARSFADSNQMRHYKSQNGI